MRRMEEARKRYGEVLIPEELSERIAWEVEKADRRRKMERQADRKRRSIRGIAAAAAALAVFVTVLNTSTAFARSMGELPVIGAIAKVLTFRSYEEETEDDLKISVEIPSIEMIAEGTGNLATSVNEEILAMCETYAEEALERAREYRQAFLETGGTEEEWAAHNIRIRVWYEVKAHTDAYLSVAVTGSESWSDAYSEIRYYNFDLAKGRRVTLADLLGENYAEIAEDSILSQIPEKEAESGLDYWEEDFPGVTADTKFYLNEAGNPVVVLDEYEIAPGAAGRPEFEITGELAEGAAEAISGETMQGAAASAAYEDNFAVDGEAAAAFGKKVQEAAASRDPEALAELMTYPVYVGIPGTEGVVESREAFLVLDETKIFTGELLSSVASADLETLDASMAGFVLSGGNSSANIIFGVVDGELAVTGINY